MAALSNTQYGPSELRIWLHQRAAEESSPSDVLLTERHRVEETGHQWAAEREAEMDSAHLAASVYQVLDAALDADSNTAAQECAYLARRATSDDEAETAVGWLLREAGYDVSDMVFWLPPAPSTPTSS